MRVCVNFSVAFPAFPSSSFVRPSKATNFTLYLQQALCIGSNAYDDYMVNWSFCCLFFAVSPVGRQKHSLIDACLDHLNAAVKLGACLNCSSHW